MFSSMSFSRAVLLCIHFDAALDDTVGFPSSHPQCHAFVHCLKPEPTRRMT